MATTSSLPESKFSTNPATIANNKSKPEGSIYANFWLSPASSSATETDTEINQVATTTTTTIDAGYSNSATTIMTSNSSDSAFYCDENLLDIMPLHVEQTLGEGYGFFKFITSRTSAVFPSQLHLKCDPYWFEWRILKKIKKLVIFSYQLLQQQYFGICNSTEYCTSTYHGTIF